MKRIVVYALCFSCMSFSLQAMINEDLKEELKKVLVSDDDVKVKQCYETICTYVVSNKINSFKHYCDPFKKECRDEIKQYMPSINESNVGFLKFQQMEAKFNEVLKEHLKDAKELYAQKQEYELEHLKNKHLCDIMLVGCIGLASGFFIGVYKYGIC